MASHETDRAKVLKRLEADGWDLVRYGADHDIYRHADKSGTIVLPRHRTLSLGVARSVAKGAGWT